MYAKISIVGRVGRDPETREAGGKTVTKMSVVTDRGYGDRKTSTWWNVEVWGKTAEFVAQYIKKGAKVAVGGDAYLEEYKEKQYLKISADAVTIVHQEKPKTEETVADFEY